MEAGDGQPGGREDVDDRVDVLYAGGLRRVLPEPVVAHFAQLALLVVVQAPRDRAVPHLDAGPVRRAVVAAGALCARHCRCDQAAAAGDAGKGRALLLVAGEGVPRLALRAVPARGVPFAVRYVAVSGAAAVGQEEIFNAGGASLIARFGATGETGVAVEQGAGLAGGAGAGVGVGGAPRDVLVCLLADLVLRAEEEPFLAKLTMPLGVVLRAVFGTSDESDALRGGRVGVVDEE